MNLSGKAISKKDGEERKSSKSKSNGLQGQSTGLHDSKVISDGRPVSLNPSEESVLFQFEKGSWMKGVKDWVKNTIACAIELDIAETSCYNVGVIVNPIVKEMSEKSKDFEPSPFIQVENFDLEEVYDPDSHRAVNSTASSEIVNPVNL